MVAVNVFAIVNMMYLLSSMKNQLSSSLKTVLLDAKPAVGFAPLEL